MLNSLLDSLLNFLQQYEQFFVILGVVSALLFVLTLLLTPYLLGLIPQDYFLINTQPSSSHFLLRLLKNMAGILLVLAGLIMLITPGQGIVSILLGLFLMEFPGKRKLEIKLINHDGTFKTLNWLRAKANKPAFTRKT